MRWVGMISQIYHVCPRIGNRPSERDEWRMGWTWKRDITNPTSQFHRWCVLMWYSWWCGVA